MSDLTPCCPRCGDLVEAGTARCPSCGGRVYLAAHEFPETPEQARFIVTEIEGFLEALSSRSGLSCHVLDRAFCHRVVFTAATDAREDQARNAAGVFEPLTPWEKRERVRGLARARAMELNAA